MRRLLRAPMCRLEHRSRGNKSRRTHASQLPGRIACARACPPPHAARGGPRRSARPRVDDRQPRGGSPGCLALAQAAKQTAARWSSTGIPRAMPRESEQPRGARCTLQKRPAEGRSAHGHGHGLLGRRGPNVHVATRPRCARTVQTVGTEPDRPVDFGRWGHVRRRGIRRAHLFACSRVEGAEPGHPRRRWARTARDRSQERHPGPGCSKCTPKPSGREKSGPGGLG